MPDTVIRACSIRRCLWGHWGLALSENHSSVVRTVSAQASVPRISSQWLVALEKCMFNC